MSKTPLKIIRKAIFEDKHYFISGVCTGVVILIVAFYVLIWLNATPDSLAQGKLSSSSPDEGLSWAIAVIGLVALVAAIRLGLHGKELSKK